MKNLLIMALFAVLIPSYAVGDSFHVEWEYPDTVAGLDSFRLYDANNVAVADFPVDLRADDFDYALEECTGFYLTAYSTTRESKISNVYTLCPKELVRFEAVGTMLIIRNEE